MSLLEWIENTGLAEYVRIALYAYPAMITLHSLGLAIMVGLSSILSLRVLGLFSAIPLGAVKNLLKIAWVGFIVNFISGGALFTTQATTYITDWTFIIKMTFVILGAVFVAILQDAVSVDSSPDGTTAKRPGLAKIVAVFTLISWAIAMVAGRLIAYI